MKRTLIAIAILLGFAGLVMFLTLKPEISGNVVVSGYNSDTIGSLFGLAFMFISLLLVFYAVHLKKKEVIHLSKRKR